MENSLVLFRHDHLNKADFYISKYPVSCGEYAALVGAAAATGAEYGLVKKTTWAEALAYCNLLSAGQGLPPAYNLEYGLLVDEAGDEVPAAHLARGYRLPAWFEWQQAALGALNGERYGRGDHRAILEKNFYRGAWKKAPGGCEELAKLEENPAGLAGLLRPDREWVSDNREWPQSRKLQSCGWEETVGRDDQFCLEVQVRNAPEGTLLPFRVVRTNIDK
jgi:formylglycine-generating enzyme required for sulfatase activity